MTVLLLFFSLFASLSGLLTYPQTYYYGLQESKFLADHEEIYDAAEHIKTLPEGTILSLTKRLGGGQHLFYYTRYPFLRGYRNVYSEETIYAKEGLDTDQLRSMVADHNVTYILVEKEKNEVIPEDYSIIWEKGRYQAYETGNIKL
ncbi:hypothetical protein ACFLRC_00270 [Candidatus Altiarchaeota archaeon]